MTQINPQPEPEYNDPPETWEDFLAQECEPMITVERMNEVFEIVYGKEEDESKNQSDS